LQSWFVFNVSVSKLRLYLTWCWVHERKKEIDSLSAFWDSLLETVADAVVLVDLAAVAVAEVVVVRLRAVVAARAFSKPGPKCS
jgi:hypothetical protein